MHNDQSAQDAARLLVAFSTNHEEAKMVNASEMDRAFAPNWADAEQAGLNRVRRDNAMRWLVENNMLEREEGAEKLLETGEGLPNYDFGSAFRITDTGQELLKEMWEDRKQE
jgi:hypothetical protein